MMNKYILSFFGCLLAFSISAQETNKKFRTLIVIFDGLRPDYITEEKMPNLYALKKAGAYGTDNHSVFPTVTRVNASSYATGSYPSKHGLLGNTVYFPEVDKTKGLNTGDATELIRIAQAKQNKLLTSISLGEILQQKGERFMVFSSGSSGQAYLQNHKVSGGAVVNPDLILPVEMKEDILKTIGPAPAHSKPNKAQHQWATDALLHYGLSSEGPLVNAIWFSDPDGTAHSDGIGSMLAMESIRIVDEEFGRILSTLENRGLREKFNIIVSTDHGFVTHVGTEGLADFLIKQGLKKDKDSEDVVLAGGAVYVKDHDKTLITKIISVLQAQEWVGAIFTKSAKPGELKGAVKGTLSFESIHWNHAERMADILVDYNWDNRKNQFGYEGASFSKGVAGHGSSSAYEIHIPLIAQGPAFKKSYESDLPTSNIDIVPTILHLHRIDIPSQMDGRIMNELLITPPAKTNEVAKKETIEATVKHAWGIYTLTLERTVLGKRSYVNYTKVNREFNTAKAK